MNAGARRSFCRAQMRTVRYISHVIINEGYRFVKMCIVKLYYNSTRGIHALPPESPLRVLYRLFCNACFILYPVPPYLSIASGRKLPVFRQKKTGSFCSPLRFISADAPPGAMSPNNVGAPSLSRYKQSVFFLHSLELFADGICQNQKEDHV